MIKIRQSVAHLVTSAVVHPDDVIDDVIGGRGPLSESEWLTFIQLPSTEVSVCD